MQQILQLHQVDVAIADPPRSDRASRRTSRRPTPRGAAPPTENAAPIRSGHPTGSIARLRPHPRTARSGRSARGRSAHPRLGVLFEPANLVERVSTKTGDVHRRTFGPQLPDQQQQADSPPVRADSGRRRAGRAPPEQSGRHRLSSGAARGVEAGVAAATFSAAGTRPKQRGVRTRERRVVISHG